MNISVNLAALRTVRHTKNATADAVPESWPACVEVGVVLLALVFGG